MPGLPGLFLATIFSATLSTASSGINSLTAVLWEDFLKMPLHGLDDARKGTVMKSISVSKWDILWPIFGCSKLALLWGLDDFSVAKMYQLVGIL